jgi:hypothetical protein
MSCRKIIISILIKTQKMTIHNRTHPQENILNYSIKCSLKCKSKKKKNLKINQFKYKSNIKIKKKVRK